MESDEAMQAAGYWYGSRALKGSDVAARPRLTAPFAVCLLMWFSISAGR